MVPSTNGNLENTGSNHTVSELRDVRLSVPVSSNANIPLSSASLTPVTCVNKPICTTAVMGTPIPTYTQNGRLMASRVIGASTIIHQDPLGLRVNQNLYQGMNLPRLNMQDIYNP